MLRYVDVFDYFAFIVLLRDRNGMHPGLNSNNQLAVRIDLPFRLAINIDISSRGAVCYFDQSQRLSWLFGHQNDALLEGLSTLQRHRPLSRLIPVSGNYEGVRANQPRDKPSAFLALYCRSVHGEARSLLVCGDHQLPLGSKRMHHQGGCIRDIDRKTSLVVTFAKADFVV